MKIQENGLQRMASNCRADDSGRLVFLFKYAHYAYFTFFDALLHV